MRPRARASDAALTAPRSASAQVIGTLKGHDDKVRVVLNKSDQVDQQQLMRVYGALMWSLGKVFRSPEVRVLGHGMVPAAVSSAGSRELSKF